MGQTVLGSACGPLASSKMSRAVLGTMGDPWWQKTFHGPFLVGGSHRTWHDVLSPLSCQALASLRRAACSLSKALTVTGLYSILHDTAKGSCGNLIPPLNSLLCLVLGLGPAPKVTAKSGWLRKNVPTGVSWDSALLLRDLSTVTAFRSAHLPQAGLPGYSNDHHSLPLGSLDSFKPSGWI